MTKGGVYMTLPIHKLPCTAKLSNKIPQNTKIKYLKFVKQNTANHSNRPLQITEIVV